MHPCLSVAACVQVVDTDTGKFKFDNVRTSSGFFLKRGQDEIIKRLEHRIAEWTRLPVENGEPFHILRYQVCGQTAVASSHRCSGSAATRLARMQRPSSHVPCAC
jgi:hypothetical protein